MVNLVISLVGSGETGPTTCSPGGLHWFQPRHWQLPPRASLALGAAAVEPLPEDGLVAAHAGDATGGPGDPELGAAAVAEVRL